MSEPLDPGIVAMATEYARLLCTARDCERRDEQWSQHYAHAMRFAAATLLTMAPGASGPHLDTIKRIMEIDTATTDPNVILMRASVIAPTHRKG